MTLPELPATLLDPALSFGKAIKAGSPDNNKGKRVRVQAFQKVVTNNQMKIQRVSSTTPEPSGRQSHASTPIRLPTSSAGCANRQPMASSTLHNSLAGSLQLKAHPTAASALKTACITSSLALAPEAAPPALPARTNPAGPIDAAVAPPADAPAPAAAPYTDIAASSAAPRADVPTPAAPPPAPAATSEAVAGPKSAPQRPAATGSQGTQSGTTLLTPARPDPRISRRRAAWSRMSTR